MAIAAFYLIGGVYFWLIQDQSILKPQPLSHWSATPADLKPPLKFENIEITAAQSAIHGYWLPSTEGAPVALYLHGQDATIGKNLHHAQGLHEMGCHVLVIDYRGYGKTFGTLTPSEASICDDANLAWDYLLAHHGFEPEQILIYGHSLGGAVAIDLASRHPEAGGLIVESSFTSIMDIVRWKVPLTHIYPLTFILRHQFDSMRKVQEYDMPPTLFIHGKSDTKVPHFMSEALHAAARGQPYKDLLLLDGGEHAVRNNSQDLYRTRTSDFIRKFVKTTPALATQVDDPS